MKIAFDDITDIGEPFNVMELERRFNSFGCLLFNNFNACAADDGLCCFACFKRIVEEEAEDAMVLEVEGRFNMMLVWFNKKIKKQKLKNLQQKPSMRR